MSETSEGKSTASREAQDFTPYRLRPKVCTACRTAKPRVAFPKKYDGGYAERCSDCRAAKLRARPRKKSRKLEAARLETVGEGRETV